MNNEERKQLICAAIDKHLASGGKLMYMGWGIHISLDARHVSTWEFSVGQYHGRCCCALSALYVRTPVGESHCRYASAKTILDTNSEWVTAFVAGFDDCCDSHLWDDEAKEAYKIGKALHFKYRPTHATLLERDK